MADVVSGMSGKSLAYSALRFFRHLLERCRHLARFGAHDEQLQRALRAQAMPLGLEARNGPAALRVWSMCNLYSITTNQAAIIALFRVLNRYVGNLPPMPGVFPDYPAPVVRNDGGESEMVMMRVFGELSESHMLVHVEGVKNRDARLVGLD